MATISEANAIAAARAHLGLSLSTPAQALHVSRVEPNGESHYLVVFGQTQAVVAVAAVDATSGELMVQASLPGTGPHITIDSGNAVQRAGFQPGSRTRLVWKSCEASRSPLYPLWE